MLSVRRESSNLLSNLQNFIGFTITQQKMRIKLPKLLVKTIPRRNNKSRCAPSDGNCSKKKRSAKAKAKIVLPKKIASIFSRGLGRKKSQKMSSSGDGTDMVNNSDGASRGCIEVAVMQILPGVEADGSGSLKLDMGDNNGRNIWDQLFPLGPRKATLSISQSFKEMLHNRGKFNGGKNSEKSTDAGRQGVNICLTSQKFLGKSVGFNFTKWKVSNRNSSNLDATEDTGDISVVCDKTSDNHVSGEKSSKILPRIPGWKPGCHRNIKSQKCVLRKVARRGEESEPGNENGGWKEETGKMELCKKRILMGGRCRPLNKSGRLHYDENGILLPEEALPSEES